MIAKLVACTILSARPEDCVRNHQKDTDFKAFEIMNLKNCSVYVGVAAGRPDVTEAAFDAWVPPASAGWIKSTGGVRYTTMDSSCLYASPGGAAGVQAATLDAGEPWAGGPIAWKYLANTCASSDTVMGGCFPRACDGLDPANGSLRYYEIAKCHRLQWSAGRAVATITDPDGNVYAMHSTVTAEHAAAGSPAPLGVLLAHDSGGAEAVGGASSESSLANTTAPPLLKPGVKPLALAALPAGWVRGTMEVPSSGLELVPAVPDSTGGGSLPVVVGSSGSGSGSAGRATFGEFACGYALLSDAAGNAYHRVVTTTGSRNVLPQLELIFGGRTFAEAQARAGLRGSSAAM